ncbi:MAG TPA: serine O-acetyltransferase EpsC [Planctomycetota bacterium]|nr:serine O-acetyltransferase EpsC [Planctomycetota bacterium]
MYNDVHRITELQATTAGKIASVVVNPCLWAIVCYRLGHWLWKNDVMLLPRLLSAVARVLTGIEIAPSASIGAGLLIVHGSGVAIEAGARIGARVTIYQGVGIGRRYGDRAYDGLPTIGDDVQIFAGAKILGPVTIGSRSRVGANAVVMRSFPDDTTIAGVPAHSVARTDASTTTTAAEGTLAVTGGVRQPQPLQAGAYAFQRNEATP